MKLRNPLLIAAAAMNLVAVALYLWALQDYTTVNLRVEGGSLSATVNGKSVAATDTTYPTGRVGLMLENYRVHRAYVSAGGPNTGIRRLSEEAGDWIVRSNLPSAWAEIRVTGSAAGDLRSDFRGQGARGWTEGTSAWEVNTLGEYRPATSGTILTGGRDWKDYAVEAQLARGKELAGVLVRAQNAKSAYRFWLRPEHGDMGWELLAEGKSLKSLAGGSYSLEFGSGLKALLREVLWSYFFGLAILAFVLVASVPLAFALARSRLSIHLPEPKVSATLAAAVMAVAGTVVAAIVAVVLLGRIPHVQDSVTYLFQAETIARGMFSVPAPPLPDFFKQEFLVVQGEQWFGKYPPGHPLVLAIGVLLGVPWLVSPVLGGLALFLIYLFGRNLHGARIALLASLLALLSPFFIFMSGSFMAHPTGLFFITLFLLAFVKMTKSRNLVWALLAGFAIGFAAITRLLTTVTLALPFGMYFVYLLAGDPRRHIDKLLVFISGATVPLTFWLVYNWSLTGDPFADTYQLYWFFDKIGFGESFGGAGPHTLEQGLRNTWANLTTLQFHLFGWPNYLTLALLLLPFATLRASRWDWMLLAAFLLTMAGYVFYWAHGIMYGPRYYYESLPMLVLLTARGFSLLPKLAQDLLSAFSAQQSAIKNQQSKIENQESAFSDQLSALSKSRGRGADSSFIIHHSSFTKALSALVLLALIGYSLIFYMPIQWGIHKDYNYVSPKAQRFVEEAGVRNALVFVAHEPTWQWWKYGAVFSANSPLLDSNVVYARDLGDASNARLMPYFPGRRAYRLTEGPDLIPLSKP
ncbi:MAG: glycosyltransferase family 39 protein [Chloroflexi bacterium]|nr:glycosyltransferase family 39 protein [Chloroflexota bacterium]